MSRWEQAVRRAARRQVWAHNPASVTLAGAALQMARLLDQGDLRPMLRVRLAATLTHLSECAPAPGSTVDKLRAELADQEATHFKRTRNGSTSDTERRISIDAGFG